MHSSWFNHPLVGLAGVAVGVGLFTAPLADGTQMLGTPSIAIEDGTGVILGGIGTLDGQPVDLTIDIPMGVTIRQVLAYWEGRTRVPEDHALTDTIMLGGQMITGDRICEASYFFRNAYAGSYRADVTANNLVTNGPNTLSVSGLDFTTASNGVGLAVIVDDGSGAFPIDVRDGSDNAFINFAEPNRTTTPVVFNFAAATMGRTARVGHFVASVDTARPNVILVLVDGAEADRIVDPLGDTDGREWDSFEHDVAIPAGATSLSVEILSRDEGTGPYAGNLEASLTWVYTSLVLAPEIPDDFEGCTPGFWWGGRGKRLWDGQGSDDVTTSIKSTDLFNATVGRGTALTGLPDTAILRSALKDNDNQVLSALNRHTAAALANSDTPDMNYRYTTAEVIQFYQDAVDGVRDIEDTKDLLELENERGCAF